MWRDVAAVLHALPDRLAPEMWAAVAAGAVVLLLLILWVLQRTDSDRARQRMRLDAVLRSTVDGVLIVDRKGAIRQSNPAATRILQRHGTELRGMRVVDLLGSRFSSKALRGMARSQSESGEHNIRLLYNLPPPGGQRHLKLLWHVLRGRSHAHLCLLRPEEPAGTARPAKRDAERDLLTELPGREGLVRRLEGAVMRMVERSEGAECSLVLLNIDRFGKVNDHLGPSLADVVLSQIAQRLGSAGNGHYLARLEGDQFGLLVAGHMPTPAVARLLKALKQAVEEPIKIQHHELKLTASMGILVNAKEYRYAAELLRDASIAMDYAKTRGLGQFKIFDSKMRNYALKHARIEADLRKALASGELRAVYQPIVDIQRKRLAGFETLIRWRHPEHGDISPGEFIEIAEDSERITAIGRYIREASCQRLAQWQQLARDLALYLSFNLTDQEAREPGLAGELRACLENYSLEPHSVRIELVERMLLEDDSRAALEPIVALGCPIYIDDFGTGYSSFSRLYDAPVHTLKIDRSFVQQMTRSERGHKVVSAIAGLGHSLGVNLVAEGVEYLDELTEIEALGCHYIQGYLFSAAVEAEAVPALLRDQSWIEKRLRLASKSL